MAEHFKSVALPPSSHANAPLLHALKTQLAKNAEATAMCRRLAAQTAKWRDKYKTPTEVSTQREAREAIELEVNVRECMKSILKVMSSAEQKRSTNDEEARRGAYTELSRINRLARGREREFRERLRVLRTVRFTKSLGSPASKKRARETDDLPTPRRAVAARGEGPPRTKDAQTQCPEAPKKAAAKKEASHTEHDIVIQLGTAAKLVLWELEIATAARSGEDGVETDAYDSDAETPGPPANRKRKKHP